MSWSSVAALYDVEHLGQPKSGLCRLMDAVCESVSLGRMTNLDRRDIDPPQKGDCAAAVIWPTMPAMRRRLVSYGLVNRHTMRVTASDGTVWLHPVERDEQGNPIPGQIDRWLNLLWVPPGMDTIPPTAEL